MMLKPKPNLLLTSAVMLTWASLLLLLRAAAAARRHSAAGSFLEAGGHRVAGSFLGAGGHSAGESFLEAGRQLARRSQQLDLEGLATGFEEQQRDSAQEASLDASASQVGPTGPTKRRSLGGRRRWFTKVRKVKVPRHKPKAARNKSRASPAQEAPTPPSSNPSSASQSDGSQSDVGMLSRAVPDMELHGLAVFVDDDSALIAQTAQGQPKTEAARQPKFTATSSPKVVAAPTPPPDYSGYIPWCGGPGGRNPKWWNTSTAYARFDAYGCTSISGIHTAQTHLKTVILIDRTDANNTHMKLPGTNQNAYGEELTLTNANPIYPAEERALNVKSNVFCSSGQIMPDGTLVSIGGSSDASNADPLLNGSFAIRAFRPCTNKTCDFELVGDMTTKRWYPTTQIMPDGRVFIVGGANVYGNIAINSYARNNPTVEYWPRKKGEGNYFLTFLVDTLPFNLYAFVHVLPSGLVFIFTADRYILFDTRTNQPVLGRKTPPLNVTTQDKTKIPIFRQYPTAGSSAMFPLTSKNGYMAEIMICGGNNAMATIVNGDGKGSTARGHIPADYNCWRITPEAANPVWTNEIMCNWPVCDTMFRRVMPDMVVLVDGSVLVINGAQQGYEGLKQSYANVAQLQPLIYLTHNYSWYPFSRLPQSNVPRVYHSSALLLHDTTVLLSGSNPNPSLWIAGGFPTEFRMEKFVPPYLMTGRQRPALWMAPKSVAVNTTFSVYFNASKTAPVSNTTERFKVSMVYPGFATHNQRHGMRHIDLDITAVVRIRNVTFKVDVRSPPNVYIGIPTLYWIHVLDSGVPNLEGFPINLTRAGKTSYTSF